MATWPLASVFNEAYLELYDFSESKARAQAELIASLLDVPVGAWLADICCGHGRHAAVLREMGYRIVGIDLSHPFLLRATEAGVPCVEADATALPLADRWFDGAFCYFTSIGYGTEAAAVEFRDEAGRLPGRDSQRRVAVATAG